MDTDMFSFERLKQQWWDLYSVCNSPALWQAVKPPELNPETEESLPSRRSPEGPDPPVLTEVPPTPPSDSPPDLESVEKKMDQGRYSSVVSIFWEDISTVLTNWTICEVCPLYFSQIVAALKHFLCRFQYCVCVPVSPLGGQAGAV